LNQIYLLRQGSCSFAIASNTHGGLETFSETDQDSCYCKGNNIEDSKFSTLREKTHLLSSINGNKIRNPQL